MTHPEYQYLNLLKDVLENGDEKSVFGADTTVKSVFGRQIRFDLQEGFPVYTTKKTFYKGAFEEMLWFIEGSGNITLLIQKNVNIWNEWAWKYCKQTQPELANSFSSQSEFVAYLKQTGEPFTIPIHYTNFTKWEGYLDQMNWVVTELPKQPERKSYYVTCWNPTQAYQMAEKSGNESVVLVACHTDHILNTTGGKLNLRVTIRSNDLFLGNPFNVAQYAMLLHMYAFLTGFEVGDLVVNIDDAHVYSNHIGQCEEQITRTPFKFPTFEIKNRGQKKMQDFVIEDFSVIGYESHGALKGEITVVGGY